MLRGKRVDLMEAKRTLPPSELAAIVVNVPGQGKCLPWKGSDIAVDADGTLFL